MYIYIYIYRVLPAVGQGFLLRYALRGSTAAVKWLPGVYDCA